MKIFELGAIDSDFSEAAGGKARGLDNLLRQGFNVPRGFVLVNGDIDSAEGLETAAAHFLKSGMSRVAVRSSATAEDGADFSFAGQFKTFLDIKTTEDFKKAVAECVESITNGPAKEYADHFGKSGDIRMSVVVQEMVDADFAGVCFTIDPGNSNNMLIETVKGLGEALVSGTATAEQYTIPLDVTNFENLCAGKEILTPQMLREICTQAKTMHESFGMPMDSEWAVRDGVLYWLQARPITVVETCSENEFDPKEGLTGHVITRCNISEMLPGAVTPLTISTSLYAIDWGLREMLRRAGAIKKVDDLSPFAAALPARGHLFINLSTLYRLTNSCFLTAKKEIEFSICGRAIDEVGVIPGKRAFFLRRLKNTFSYLKFILSSKKARVKLAKIADKFTIKTSDNPEKLYEEISNARTTLERVAVLHYITSAHSGAMSSALLKTMQKKIDDIEECKAILTKLLERIDGIESVDILASLKRIAAKVVEENPQAAKLDSEGLARYLETAGETVQDVCNNFFTRHGHRAIREAEMRNKGWANDHDAFVDYLHTVISSDNFKIEIHAEPDLKAIFHEHGFRRTRMLMYFTKQAREGVKNREYSKSKLVRVLNEFKIAYSCLARILVDEKKLPDQDAIFFLTHQEIGNLVSIDDDTLSKKALQRRRLLNSQTELRFNEIYTGLPQPLPPPDLNNTSNVLTGTPISRGIITGPARVVRNINDAKKLKKGEIMVAVFTDIGWSPYYCLIEGLVTEIGSALSHGAVVAREYALPFVSNITGATSVIKTGDIIKVNGTTGTVEISLKKEC